MGIDLGSLAPVAGEGGLLDLGGTFIGAVNNLVKGIGYFAGGDLQEALGKGFMA
ncbi:hypothetical protein [Dietzia sp. Alg238-R159]|uniref:hypothetical protein n=1 Tax=Dietzia sp. Alg238-R159 TaxID=2305986 RepID=UPI0019678F83|nr:hypothetical protein [Dietzia sp. Alg238-R159]